MPGPEDKAIAEALKRDRTVDISTRGRRSGQWRRIEIWFHNLDGRIYLTSIPGPRDWRANILEHGELIFHLKESVQADLPARGRSVSDPAVREAVLGNPLMDWYHRRSGSRQTFVSEAVLVEVILDH